ncbi:Citramalyl-CoA lyase [Sarcoptes scabiei]|uniref:Citramalyl-CoA lyase, mitochondrial n=1 Tax=Sarcoptes scabiei TaxID=52283 RepID=A0A834VET2_SARSC|nr:Citramalyl-CoA lyase [Sarcoptes scabiei]
MIRLIPRIISFDPRPIFGCLACKRNLSTTQNDDLFDSNILPRRAILYVPGNDQRKIDKALGTFKQIDSIVLDCEDGVAANNKNKARETIKKVMDQTSNADDRSKLWSKLSVRINSIQSNLACDDLRQILSASCVPRTILLPKVDSIEHIEKYFRSSIEANNKLIDKESDQIDLITYVESAIGLLDLRTICQFTMEQCQQNGFRFAGIIFGSDDFCADIGATRTDNGDEVLLARQQVVLIAKSFNLQAIDSVYINFKDLDGLKRQSENGSMMGFTGKQCIHPGQIPIIQEAFRPSAKKVQWATGLIEAFERAQKSGQGAFVYEGQMIDMPLLRQAYNILNLNQQIVQNE